MSQKKQAPMNIVSSINSALKEDKCHDFKLLLAKNVGLGTIHKHF